MSNSSFIYYLTNFRRRTSHDIKLEKELEKKHQLDIEINKEIEKNNGYFSYGSIYPLFYKILSRDEEIELAKNREQMSKASIANILEQKKKIDLEYSERAEILPNNMDYSNNQIIWKKCLSRNDLFLKGMILRDLYSYTIINYLAIQHNFKVYGGFVAAHISGKNWLNIDMIAPYERMAQMEFMTQIVTFLRFIFGFKSTEIELTDETNYEQQMSNYYDSYKYLLHIYEGEFKHQIKINVIFRMNNNIQDTDYIPVTIGKCLIMHNSNITMRKIPSQYMIPPILRTITVDDIIEILRTGKDISLSCEGIYSSIDVDNQLYKQYFNNHISRAQELSYKIDKSIGNLSYSADYIPNS